MWATDITWSPDIVKGQFDAATHVPDSPDEVMQDSGSGSDCVS